MSRVAAFLHSGPHRHDEWLPRDVEWIDVDAGPVTHDSGNGPIGPAALCGLALRLAGARGAAIRRQLDELSARGGRLVLCADDAALALAVAYGYLWTRPIMPMRLVADPLIPLQGRFAHWFCNGSCYALIATSAELRDALYAHCAAGHSLPSIVGPMSDGAETGRDIIRNAVDIAAQMPNGDEHIRLAYVSHFYSDQDHPEFALSLIRQYATYDAAVLDRVHFVIVDDGSPVQYEIPDVDLNLTWLKIDRDIRWNMAGARNLGVVYARADNVFLTDIDIEVPGETLRYLAARRPCGKWMYRPAMRDQETGAKLGRHPNVFLLSRARFLRFFGCDEDFSGHYGFEDLRFTKHQKLEGTFLARLPPKWLVYNRKLLRDGGLPHSLHRDKSWNALVDARKRFEIEWYGRNAGHSRENLQFTWTVLADRRRKRPVPDRDRLFKPTWYWRQIWPI